MNHFFRKPILLITATLFSGSIINAQNVGIGTATPQLGKLEVKGSTGAVSAIFYDQSTGVAIENNHPGIGFNSYYNGGRKAIAPGFGGLLGMDPASGKLHIYTAPASIATAGAPMLLTERMSILANGNVGIGIAAPTAKLDVAGNLKIADGTQGEGKILTSDELGNASWQSGASLVPGASIGYGTWGDCATNGNIGAYQPLTGAAGVNNFGKSVSLSGNYAIVGAPFETVGSNYSQGTASIYRLDGNGWVLMQKLTDATGAAYEHFGSSVAISGQYAHCSYCRRPRRKWRAWFCNHLSIQWQHLAAAKNYANQPCKPGFLWQ
ncbi:MAG: hypothetical protein EOO03_06465 [Chitinophagaceae bacterium]|nr:MAG: hypothetical protein EOO03_06465 [Chitinophagaceae bacterium]